MELVLGLHQECPGVVKLVMELHHVSQWGKQGELRDGGASVWASPCEFVEALSFLKSWQTRIFNFPSAPTFLGTTTMGDIHSELTTE